MFSLILAYLLSLLFVGLPSCVKNKKRKKETKNETKKGRELRELPHGNCKIAFEKKGIFFSTKNVISVRSKTCIVVAEQLIYLNIIFSPNASSKYFNVFF